MERANAINLTIYEHIRQIPRVIPMVRFFIKLRKKLLDHVPNEVREVAATVSSFPRFAVAVVFFVAA